MCFRYLTAATAGGTLVAKGAKLPAPNTCETLALFEKLQTGLEGAATGSICVDVNGATAHGTDSGLTVISAGFRGGSSYSNSLIFCVF
jgi:hypothetical protein